jgi:hypothetical protein
MNEQVDWMRGMEHEQRNSGKSSASGDSNLVIIVTAEAARSAALGVVHDHVSSSCVRAGGRQQQKLKGEKDSRLMLHIML